MKTQSARRSGNCLWLALFLFGLAMNSSAWAQSAKSDEKPPSPENSPKSLLPTTAFINAEIRTCGPAGTIAQGTIIVQAGKILAVGDESLEIPERAKRVDLSGTVITPGLIDARSTLWLHDPSSDSGASDASLNIVDAIDPFSDDWKEVIPHGVTSVYVQPSRPGILGGYGAVLSVAPTNGEPDVLLEQAALQASLGIGASSNRSRQQQLERTKKVLLAAAEYQKKWNEYEEYLKKKAAKEKSADKTSKGSESKESGKQSPQKSTPARGESKGGDRDKKEDEEAEEKKEVEQEKKEAPAKKSADGQKSGEKAAEDKPPKKPEKDPAKDRLVQVLEGKIPLRLELHTADDVAFASKMLEDEKLSKIQVIYEGLSDLRSATSSIAATNNPLVLGPWLASELMHSATKLSEETWGEKFAEYPGGVVIGTFGSRGQNSRMLRAHASKAVANGFSSERALKAITIDAARTLGVAKEIGSIETGKRADLVCFSGDPTDLSSRVNLVVAAGEIRFQAADVVSRKSESAGEQSVDSLPSRLPKRYAVRSSRCLVEGKLQPATLIVENKKLAKILKGEDSPGPDVKVYDLGSMVITPGIVSAHATLGIERFVDPRNLPEASFITAADCLAAAESKQDSLVESGLLRVLLAPGSSNPVAGTASLVRLGTAEPVVKRDAALKLVLASQARSTDRFPSSLAGQVRLLQQALSGVLVEARVYLPEAVEEDLVKRGLSALKAATEGDRLVLIEAETDAEIRSALDLIDQYQLRAAILGPQQLKPFIDRFRELKVTWIVKPITPSTYNWFSQDIALASKAGVNIAFEGETAEQLRLTAASCGLDPDVALAALCDPEYVVLGKSVLTAGSPADFVVWSDTPVNLAARPEHIVVDGSIVTEKE